MNGTRSLSSVTGRKFMRGKLGLVCDPSLILLGLAGFDGKLKLFSPAWEKMLGFHREDLLDRPLCELMQHERSIAVALVDRLLAEDSSERMEFGLRCQDGTCKWFIWHRRFDSENQAIFIAGYDITEQKAREIAAILAHRAFRANGMIKTGVQSSPSLDERLFGPVTASPWPAFL
jgi:PAS domain S-box-containing protein